jgi:hypothetical protein
LGFVVCTCAVVVYLKVAAEFSRNAKAPPIALNAAPFSGAVAWLRGLRDRIAGEE